jgi:hypothetical protein
VLLSKKTRQITTLRLSKHVNQLTNDGLSTDEGGALSSAAFSHQR